MTFRGCLLALLLAGCAGPMATASGPPAHTHTMSLPPTVSTAPSETESAMPDVTPPPLPSGFPVHASMTARGAGPGVTSSWTSDALPPEIYDYYLEALRDAGFVIDLEGPGGGAAIIRFHATDGTAYQLTFTGLGPVEIDLGAPRP